MKVTVQKKDALERKIDIEVPLETVTQKIENIYKELQKTVKVKGFREGKVPLEVVKKLYANHVKSEALDSLVNDSYVQVLREHHLEVISHPRIENLEFEEGKPLKFTAYVEVHPEVPLSQYKKLTLVREKLKTITDKEVEDTLSEIRKSRGELQEVAEKRVAQVGDYLICDLSVHEVFLTSKIKEFLKRFGLETGKSENQMFVVDQKNELIKQCLRKNKGDQFEIKLNLPDHLKAEVKTTSQLPIQVHLKEMKHLVLPEVDEAFAKSVGFKDLATFKEDVRRHLEGQRKQEQDKKLREDLLRKLVDQNPLSIPNVLVERHEKQVQEIMESELKERNYSKEEIEEYFKKNIPDIKKQSQQELKLSMLLHKIAQAEGISVTPSDIKNEFSKMAEQSKRPIEEIEQAYQKNGWIPGLKSRVQEDKTIQFLIQNAEIKDAVH